MKNYSTTPAFVGWYKAKIVVKDSKGRTTTAQSVPIKVNERPEPAMHRALVVGQGYSGQTSALPSALYDAMGMVNALNLQHRSYYNINRKSEITSYDLIDSINTTFYDAKANDISLLYYSGRAEYSTDKYYKTALVGADNDVVPISALKSALDFVPGTKIIIIDTVLTQELGSEKGNSKEFVQSVINTFKRDNHLEYIHSNYYVIVACREENETKGFLPGKPYSLFSRNLIYGAGWDYLNNKVTGAPADSNSDGSLTLNELFEYARKQTVRSDTEQYAQAYPENSNYTVFRQ